MKSLSLLFFLLLFQFQLRSAGLDPEHDPFIIGMYSARPHTEANYRHLKSLGFNYVQEYTKTSEEVLHILNMAQKTGMKVIAETGASRLIRQSDKSGLYTEDYVRQQIKLIGSHPALGILYLCDEPTVKQIPETRRISAMMRNLADIPQALVTGWSRSYWNSCGIADIWMVDYYPVRGERSPDTPLRHFTTFYGECAEVSRRKNSLYMPILQFCDMSCFPHVVQKENRDSLRFPSMLESRFMSISSLAFGSRGVFYYSQRHAHLDRPAGQAYFSEILPKVTKELRQLTDLIPRSWKITAGDSSFNKEHRIHFAYWDRPGGRYIALTSNFPESRNLKLPLQQFTKIPANARLRPMGMTAPGNALIQDSLLQLKASPWEAFVWKLQ